MGGQWNQLRLHNKGDFRTKLPGVEGELHKVQATIEYFETFLVPFLVVVSEVRVLEYNVALLIHAEHMSFRIC